MEPLDDVLTLVTLGELDCGCPFDHEGLWHVGEWVFCPRHRVPARVARRTTATTAVLGP